MFPKFYLIIIIFSLHASCKTTSPSSLNSHNSSIASRKEIPANFRFFSLKKLLNENSFEVHAKSVGELFCETECSKFKLSNNDDRGVLEFSVTRQPIFGETSPGELDKIQKIEIIQKDFKKIIVNNFANKGHSIEINRLPSQTNEEFIFALGKIVSSMGIGGESSGYQLTIGQRSQVAVFKNQILSKELSSKNLMTPKDVIVSGVEKTFEGIERGSYQVFEVDSLEFIEIED